MEHHHLTHSTSSAKNINASPNTNLSPNNNNNNNNNNSAGPLLPPPKGPTPSTHRVKKHKNPRKPTAEEDVVDGFAFLAFKNYEELKRAITLREDKSESICVQLLRGSQGTTPPTLITKKKHNSASPNQKVRNPSKKKPKKLMDQENGDGISGGEGGRAPASPFAALNAPQSDLSPKSRVTKEPLFINHLISEDTSPDSSFKKAKISADPSADIFPISRKDSSSSTRVVEKVEIKALLPTLDRPPLKRSPPPLPQSQPPPSTNKPPTSPKLATNGGEVNGHEGVNPVKSNGQTFFTPYATNTITRVNLPTDPPINKDLEPTPTQKISKGTELSTSQSSITSSKCGGATGKVTPTSSKSMVFGSIARLLDSPTTSSSSSNRSSPSVVISSNHVSPQQQQQSSQAPVVTSGSSGLRDFGTHSPRGHSPSRERDSYSSNVSSLSRSSVTPVSSGGSSHPPSNLSPQLPTLSYSKAASWLSSVPIPRPTPPPPPPPPHSLGLSSSSYGPPPGLPHSSPSAMFAPPIIPMTSPHPASQPSLHFPPSPDPIYHGPSSSELVRRDLESRFLSAGGDRGGSSFIGRSGDLHSLLPQHQNQAQNPTGLFPPSMYKEMPKGGMESPFYRTNLGISYGGFNGMLPPPNMGTPFAPPSQIPTFTPKKTGRWNAMHVRIAWEIYQHQQKSGNGGSEVKGMSNPALKGPSVGGPSIPPDLFRPPSHMFPGLSRPTDIQQPGGPPPFPSPLLSPHAPRGPPGFDPAQHMFLSNQASHLGSTLGRYPGFSGLSSPFGGLSSLGSSLLSRDLAALAPMGSVQDQWNRLARGGGMGVLPVPGWPPNVPQQEMKGDGRRGACSPFRDRSPVRPNRLENGDTDSRSSRSTDSHSSTHKSRLKDDNNPDKISSRTNTPISDISKSHPSRMYPSTSPVSTGGSWEGFPARFSSQESFRLSLLQLGERERELARLPPTNSIRPQHLYPNHPAQSPAPHPMLSSGHSGGHLMSAHQHHTMSHMMSSFPGPHLLNQAQHLSSSQTMNGANSPNNITTKEESSSSRSKEEPQSR